MIEVKTRFGDYIISNRLALYKIIIRLFYIFSRVMNARARARTHVIIKIDQNSHHTHVTLFAA